MDWLVHLLFFIAGGFCGVAVMCLMFIAKENEMPIRKVKGGYKIDNVKGISPTLEHAKRRLRAIKARQARDKVMKPKTS